MSVNTAYDLPSGRILSVANEGPSGGVLKSFAYSYRDPGGRDTELAQSVTDEAGNRTANTYDALERLVGAVTTGPSPSRFGYTIDGDGHRTSSTINRAGSTGGETEVYAYDSAGLPCWRGSGALPADCSSPPQGQPYAHYSHDANGSDLDNSHQRYSYNTAGQATSVAVITPGSSTPRQLAYRGPGQGQLIGDGTYTLQNNLLGIAARANTSSPLAAKALSASAASATPSYYARSADGTLLSQRNDAGRRNYLYLTTLGDENPFGYQGAYTAGIQANGVICSGPNQNNGNYYDAEDGRNTQIVADLGEDIIHGALGTMGIADGIIFGAGTVALTPVCFGGVSAAPVVGQVFGYPACGALTVGGLSASGLAFTEGIHQFKEIGGD